MELDVVFAVTQVLEALVIPYCVGGSFSSTIYGESRSTQDVDILVALLPAHIARFVTALNSAFYIQPDDVQEAITLAPMLRHTPQQRATFNMI